MDLDNNTMYLGNYKAQPAKGLTAHARLANANGLGHENHYVGGYFDKYGDMQWNSRTLQGARLGTIPNTLYSQLGVHPMQTNPLVYYGHHAFRFETPHDKW